MDLLYLFGKRWRHIVIWGGNDTGWLRSVGSIKLQVSLAKETYKRDDILQKRPILLSVLLTVATPYGLATISRLLKILGLFCKRVLYKRRYSAKETHDFKAPTHRRHPISP